MSPLIRLEKITKTFSENGVRACDEVDLEINAGEVHALLGENGAGKTTLMSILAGLVPADSGTIFLEGLPLRRDRTALEQGIALVQQHPPFSPELTLFEHVVLGREGAWGALPLRSGALKKELTALAEPWGLRLPWDKSCRSVGTLVLQKASLVAFLRFPLKVLILDEPTATLPESEAAVLLSLMLGLARQRNLAVVFITHKLHEALKWSDRITVLRNGAVAASRSPPQTSVGELRTLLFPESRQAELGLPVLDYDSSLQPLLEVQDVGLIRDRIVLLQNIDLTLCPGEILGLASLRGEGVEALEEVLTGMEESTTGEILLAGENVTGEDIAGLRRKGLAYVPSDRLGRGSSPQSMLVSNVIPYRLNELSRKGLLRHGSARDFFRSLKRRFGLAGEPGQKLSTLSGGNIQKLILARELESRPRLLVLAEPVWGLDAQARSELYLVLRRSAALGMGVLILSSETHEIREVCTRLGVLHGGRLQALKPASEWSEAELGQALLGIAE